MNSYSLFSIGYGNKDIEEFKKELKFFNISYLFDVRSKPYSKWNPAFKKRVLEEELNNEGIIYIFAGKELGGMPSDQSCYNKQGKIDYEVLKDKKFFVQGLKNLLEVYKKEKNVAVMCSEAMPEKCHRSKLIGKALLEENISMVHIINAGKTKSQETLMYEMNKGNNITDLFGNLN